LITLARRRRMADGRLVLRTSRLRKVPSPREGGLPEQQGESPGKGTETAQPRDNVMIPLRMKSPEDLLKRRHPTGASSNGRNDSHRRRVECISRMPSASKEVNRKGLMSFTWHYEVQNVRFSLRPKPYVRILFLPSPSTARLEGRRREITRTVCSSSSELPHLCAFLEPLQYGSVDYLLRQL